VNIETKAGQTKGKVDVKKKTNEKSNTMIKITQNKEIKGEINCQKYG
jgi:hypothetical protein